MHVEHCVTDTVFFAILASKQQVATGVVDNIGQVRVDNFILSRLRILVLSRTRTADGDNALHCRFVRGELVHETAVSDS